VFKRRWNLFVSNARYNRKKFPAACKAFFLQRFFPFLGRLFLYRLVPLGVFALLIFGLVQWVARNTVVLDEEAIAQDLALLAAHFAQTNTPNTLTLTNDYMTVTLESQSLQLSIRNHTTGYL